jgi:alpha-L-fucosidase
LTQRPQWGDISASKDAKTLYLHVLIWPESGVIMVSDLPSTASSASFLASGEKASFSHQDKTLEIKLPAKPLNEYDTVVKVALQDSVD